MNQEHQWTLPTKRKGTSLKTVQSKFDPIFITAIESLAASESQRIGRTVSRGTVLTNLSTKDSVFHRQMRAELRRTYLQLKRGKEHASSNIHERTDSQAE